MIDKIKKALFESYWSDEQKGIFLSWFDEQHDLIMSQWVLKSDLPLHELIDTLTDEVDEEMKDVVFVAVDIVSEIIQLESTEDILSKDPLEYGFALIGENDTSGVILPWVEWVADAKHALHNVKKKYGIEGNVEVYVFRTQRIVVSK